MSILTKPTELLAIREASEFLKVKVSTLYAWVYQRKIPFRKHGSRIVFHTEELRAWSEKRRVPEHLSRTWESAGARDTEGAGSLKTRRTEETP
jgi:excisionase family DNA binding protein